MWKCVNKSRGDSHLDTAIPHIKISRLKYTILRLCDIPMGILRSNLICGCWWNRSTEVWNRTSEPLNPSDKTWNLELCLPLYCGSPPGIATNFYHTIETFNRTHTGIPENLYLTHTHKHIEVHWSKIMLTTIIPLSGLIYFYFPCCLLISILYTNIFPWAGPHRATLSRRRHYHPLSIWFTIIS